MQIIPSSVDTICAVATPYGVGGLSVVRVSGGDAIGIVDTLFRGKRSLSDVASHTAHFGTIVLGDAGENVLDEVVCTVFRAPHSFTGEDTVEISCHGSLYIQQELMRALVSAGARTAGRGEFTKRAFMNGRMDLSQAEAVADLIAARTQAEKDVALHQLRGGIVEQITQLREQLLTFTALLELELDFADHEELQFADRSELKSLIEKAQMQLQTLLDSFESGNAIKNGLHVAIVGAPNAGKSTLLNAMTGDDRAIVSELGGTTRDTIEDTLVLGGVQVRLTDTAGIRKTEDTIEQLGIERSKQAIRQAHIIIHLLDALHPVDVLACEEIRNRQIVLTVVNKSDLLAPTAPHAADSIYISAKKRQIAPLMDMLRNETARLTAHTDSVLISNVRHFEALSRAHQALQHVRQGLDEGLSGELLAIDLHDALEALGEITGNVSSQEVLNTIFERFCIGK